jgi:uroporphyrinogen decarboxylase
LVQQERVVVASQFSQVMPSEGQVPLSNPVPMLLRACRGEPLDRPPVWMMRQAGRYMAEYQAVRKRVSFLELCKTPEIAVEVTLQPLQAFGFDASIIFSDILIPLEAMGMPLVFTDAKGPQLPEPIRSQADYERLQDFDPTEKTGFLLEALRMMRRELQTTPDVALLGFAGAPWTLAAYAIEGESWKQGMNTKAMRYREPQLLHTLLERLSRMLIDYLSAQIEAGAQAVQLFDTWGGMLAKSDYETFAAAYQRQVIQGVKARHPEVPVILFVKNSRGLIPAMAMTGAEVLSIDDLTPLDEARLLATQTTGHRPVVLQGNLDPVALATASPDILTESVEAIIRQGGRHGFIFNLGHGILPPTPVENVRHVVQTVQNWSWTARS